MANGRRIIAGTAIGCIVLRIAAATPVTVTVGDLHVGMLVDAVTEVLTINSKPVDPKKAINGKEITKFLSGIGNVDGRLIIMLNLQEIMDMPKENK